MCGQRKIDIILHYRPVAKMGLARLMLCLFIVVAAVDLGQVEGARKHGKYYLFLYFLLSWKL